MFDWDIEPRPNRNPDVESAFRAVRVVPGTGRWHTSGQAWHQAAIASGRVCNLVMRRFEYELRYIRRGQKKRRKDEG
jgi:hypothetical protein